MCLSLSRLAPRQGDVAQVEDRKRVSLSVENPALQRHQVVTGEQQVQIPEGGEGRGGGGEAGGGMGGTVGKGRSGSRRSWSS